MIGIYKITNLINGKVYIGQSINIEKRVKEHFYKAKCKKDVSYNSALHSAIRKYGEENFTWEVIAECSIDDIDELEKKYIKEYNSIVPEGYNILSGGQRNKRIPHFCKLCGQLLLSNSSTYCIECGHKIQQKCERPSKVELKEMIRNIPFTLIGKQYNVTDNAIRKWCKAYNLPYTKKDINSYSDEEWQKI